MAVAAIHGKGLRALVDEKDLSAFLKEVTVSAESDASDITTFGSNDKVFLGGGLKDATLSFNGLFAASTTAVDDVANFFDDALGGSTKHLVTVDVNRSTGGRCWMMHADNTKYDVSASVDDVASISVDAQCSDGYYGGRMLRPLLAVTTTGVSNSAVLTAGTTAAGGTTGGGLAHFHLTAQSTLTSLTGKVQHSTSGSTWADLITFTAATAETFQRSTVSGTVKEQTRFSVSAFTGGAGKSATIAAAFSRRKKT